MKIHLKKVFCIFLGSEDLKPNKNETQNNNKRMISIRGRITPAKYKIELFVTKGYGCKTVNNLYQVLHLRCCRGPISASVNFHRTSSTSFAQNILEENDVS